MTNRNILAGKDIERYWHLHGILASFHSMFNGQQSCDDRTIAIIAGTYLDELLQSLLMNFMVDDEKEVKRLVGLDGPMGTFSNRVTTAYCLGLVPGAIRDDLRTIGKIRNQFAHQLQASFDIEPVRARCFSLRWHKVSMMMTAPEEATAREVFKVNVNQLICYLNGIIGVTRLERRQAVRV